MLNRVLLALIVSVLVATPSSSTSVEETQQSNLTASEVDSYGDPLPEGAVRRLGTTRFRALATRLAFSPDGKSLAGAGDFTLNAGYLWMWDSSTGRLLYKLNTQPHPRVAMSPDNKTLLLNQRTLVDIATGKTRFELKGPKGPDTAAAFSPDGKKVAVAGFLADHQCLFWDIDKPTEFRAVYTEPRSVGDAVAFSPNNTTVAIGGQKAVSIIDIAMGKEIRRFAGHEGTKVFFVAFAQHGKLLVSASDDRTIRLWEVETGQLVRKIQTEPSVTYAVALSADGELLVSAENSLIRTWDVASGKEVRRWEAHSRVLALAFSPNGKQLASSGVLDSNVALWDCQTGTRINKPLGHSMPVDIVRFNPDGKSLTSTGRDGKVLGWSLEQGKELERYHAAPFGRSEPGWNISGIDLSPDGKYLALLENYLHNPKVDPIFSIRDTTSGEVVARDSIKGKFSFLPNGKLLIFDKLRIKIWDFSNTNAPQTELNGPGKPPSRFAISHDGKVLAVAFSAWPRSASQVSIWNIESDKEISSLDDLAAETAQIAFTPDGKKLAVVNLLSEKDQLRPWCQIYDVTSGKVSMQISVPANARMYKTNGTVDSLAFSHDGCYLAIGATHMSVSSNSKDVFAIHVFDVRTGGRVREIDSPQGRVRTLGFSVDARYLASGGDDSTILVWNIGQQAGDSK